jgi:hypothetical protein
MMENDLTTYCFLQRISEQSCDSMREANPQTYAINSLGAGQRPFNNPLTQNYEANRALYFPQQTVDTCEGLVIILGVFMECNFRDDSFCTCNSEREA